MLEEVQTHKRSKSPPCRTRREKGGGAGTLGTRDCGRATKTAAQTAEYEKLMIRFPGGIHRLDVPDPDVNWAVSRKAPASISLDRHGTVDI